MNSNVKQWLPLAVVLALGFTAILVFLGGDKAKSVSLSDRSQDLKDFQMDTLTKKTIAERREPEQLPPPAVVGDQQPQHQSADVCATPAFLSAVVDHKGGQRKFWVAPCEKSYSISDVMHVFSHHQKAWNDMGRRESWWSVLTNYPKGVADPPLDVKRKFFTTGRHDAGRARRTIADKWEAAVKRRSAGTEGEGKGLRVLDFGCGVGRMGNALAELEDVHSVTCVDQSQQHLVIAEREIARINADETEPRRRAPVHTLLSTPDMLTSIAASNGPKCFDFVHSVISLQHMMGPLQSIYLEQFCDVLAPGGFTYIQMPFMWGGPERKPPCSTTDFANLNREGGMQMHFLPMNHVRDVLGKRGCSGELRDIKQQMIGGGVGFSGSMLIMVSKDEDVSQAPLGRRCECISKNSA